MSTLTIPQSARAVFQDGMEHLAQQKASRFQKYATVKTGCTGKASAHRRIQATEMTDVTGRIQPTIGEELGLEHRYIFPRKAQKATLIDEDDAATLALSVAPTGDIALQHRMAAGRKIDKIFLDGITGQNLEGLEDTMNPMSLPPSQTVLSDYRTDGQTGQIGLTLAKLIKAKGIFGKNEVYGQDQHEEGAHLCMAVAQDELNNLLADVEETGSADYNKVRALVDGELDYFMGIHFIRSEQLAKRASTNANKIVRTCPMWVSTGVYLDFWYDVKTSIDTLPTQSQAIQVYSRIKVGAARKDEKQVVLVECEQPV
jgi:hypothetical protein